MFNRRKYWHTPPLEIIGGGGLSKPCTITNPEYIAALLDNVGLPCTPAGHTCGAQIATYHYNIDDLRHAHKADRAVKALSMAMHTPCSLIPSDRAHIAMQAARAERELVALRQTVQHLRPDRTPTTAALGLDDAGQPIIIDITKMPHMLFAGASGSGCL